MKKIALLLLLVFTTLVFGQSYLPHQRDAFRGVVTDGLVIWLRFEEGSGTSVVDYSGHGNNGTLTNGATWATGQIGNYCLSLDGSNDYVNLGNASSISISGAKSISFWINPNGSSGEMASNYNSTGTVAQWETYWNSNGTVTVCPYDEAPSGNWRIFDTPSGSAPASTWTHVCWTFDGTLNLSGVTVYINGSSVSLTPTTSGTVSLVTSGYGNGTLGRSGDFSGNYWGGKIDDFRIYNRVLTSTEVTKLYNYR